MKGVQFVVDENGNQTAVVIDLKKHSEIWEDFYDRAVARNRESEPRETLASVKTRLRSRGSTGAMHTAEAARDEMSVELASGRILSQASRVNGAPFTSSSRNSV